MTNIQEAIATLAEANDMTVVKTEGYGKHDDTDKLWIEPKTTAQKAVLEDTSPHLLHYGGWYTGKKYIGVAKAVQMAQMYPNNRVALICNERTEMRETLWKELLCIIPDSTWCILKGAPYWELSNGSVINGFGLDKDRTRMMAMEFGFALIGDAVNVSEEDYDFICDRTKLRSVHFRQVMAITEPEYDDHYLYREFLKLKQGGYASIEAELLPDIPQSYRERLDQLTGDNRLRYRDGVWVMRAEKVMRWEIGGASFHWGQNSKSIRNADSGVAVVVEEHADLVAAAPDLLEAAEGLTKLYGKHCIGCSRGVHSTFDKMIQAIAKAKGANNE